MDTKTDKTKHITLKTGKRLPDFKKQEGRISIAVFRHSWGDNHVLQVGIPSKDGWKNTTTLLLTHQIPLVIDLLKQSREYSDAK